MKSIAYLFLPVLMFVLPMSISAQDEIFASEEWEELTNKEFLIEFFDGSFSNMGVRVQETGEEITIQHHGDRLDIVEGVNPDETDYVIDISTQDIRNMVSYATDGKITDTEAYPILSYMFTSITSLTLQNESMLENVPGFVKRKDNNIHVTLHSPDHTASVSHSILYLNKEWIVVPGLRGTPKRIYNMEVSDAMEYQRRVQEAITTDTRAGWKAFNKWYKIIRN
jgi:hypothetical protein